MTELERMFEDEEWNERDLQRWSVAITKGGKRVDPADFFRTKERATVRFPPPPEA